MAVASLEKLTVQFSRLPGIGRKSAGRLAYHILGLPEEEAKELADAILEARRKVHPCPECGTYTELPICELCTDPMRNDSVVCVVSDPKDVTAMERTREYHGRYHVLFGTLSPMEGIGPKDIRIDPLLDKCKSGKVKEVILATNPDVEGEATASYIARLLKPLGVTTTRIAHGIPIGGNLEYTDEVTLAKAIEGRRNL